MSEMVIKELKMVTTVDNPSRANQDAILVQDGCNYLITFCHGACDGSLSLMVNDTSYDVEPQNLREKLSELVHYHIPDNNLLFITPCHPNLVRRRYAQELAEQNIYVVGNWNGMTGWQLGTYSNVPDMYAVKLTDSEEIITIEDIISAILSL